MGARIGLPDVLGHVRRVQIAQPILIAVLYAGNSIVLFYGSNTWAYTRLGHLDGLTADEWNVLLGWRETVLTLSLSE